MTITHSSHARYDLWYHLAWSIKYRKKVRRDDETKQEYHERVQALAKL